MGIHARGGHAEVCSVATTRSSVGGVRGTVRSATKGRGWADPQVNKVSGKAHNPKNYSPHEGAQDSEGLSGAE